MGTYYDVVCLEHKEVLRLWKAYDTAEELEYRVSKGKLIKEGNFIVLISSAFKAIIKERPLAKQWLEKHKNCKLFFIDSEGAEMFDFYVGYEVIEGQPSNSNNSIKPKP